MNLRVLLRNLLANIGKQAADLREIGCRQGIERTAGLFPFADHEVFALVAERGRFLLQAAAGFDHDLAQVRGQLFEPCLAQDSRRDNQGVVGPGEHLTDPIEFEHDVNHRSGLRAVHDTALQGRHHFG